MINANELRIGNYFIYREPESVGFFIADINNLYSVIKYPEFYYGIELTEEWLLKFGFVQITKYAPNVYTDQETTGFQLIQDDEKYYKCGYNDDYYPEGIELKYVHQLQNICFCLLGTELTIKELVK